MLTNNSKTTNPYIPIAVSYCGELNFSAINKIILLFKWLKINAIFEPIEIAGENYKKLMKYGIDEQNLTRLKKTKILINTAFDYSNFDKKTQVKADEYLNIALKLCYTTYYTNDKNIVNETNFFTKKKQYITNLDEFNIKTNNDYSNFKYDFSVSTGHNYAIFSLNNLEEQTIIKLCIQLLKYLNLNEKAEFLSKFDNVNSAINELKKNINNIITSVNFEKINTLPEIKWKNIETIYPKKLTELETTLQGEYQISQLVEKIKTKEIKIIDEYQLYQIIVDNIEYYPNINFWDEIVINPTIIIKKFEINKITF